MNVLLDRALGAFGSKLNRDIAWNLGSFAILATSGIVANLVIVTQQGTDALGVFNQVYAVYVVLSQIFVVGVHYSVLKHCAQHAEDAGEVARLLGSAVLLALLFGTLGASLAFGFAPAFARALESAGVEEGLFWVACALLLFPANKVLLAAANGLRAMRLFAVAQATRYLAIVGFVTLVAVGGWRPELDAAAFLAAEILALLVVTVGLFAGTGVRLAAPTLAWLRQHLSFGVRGMMSGLFLELNSRVDVLMIGYFMNDRAVGIYSFAAMLVDGFLHLIAVLRNNFNPLLVQFVASGDVGGLRRFVHRSAAVVYPAALAAVLAICAGYWILTELLAPGRGLQEGWAVLAILLAGLWLCAGLLPFDNLLLQAGYPGHQTFQQLVVISVNVTANLLLIPVLGIEGSALAAAAAYGCGMMTLLVLARRKLGLDLLAAQERR